MGPSNVIEDGECARFVFVIYVDDFDRIGIADDEFVRAAREFLPVIEIYVVALAVAADTLRRL